MKITKLSRRSYYSNKFTYLRIQTAWFELNRYKENPNHWVDDDYKIINYKVDLW